jgi:sugar fermentation stimulation protein A
MFNAGFHAAIVFVIQREDAWKMASNDLVYPQFAAALRRAVEAGVDAFAYRCYVMESELIFADQSPVML